MLKQEKINIADTNMALFGGPLEKEIKKNAANGEPAWKTAGKCVGIDIWRVEKFKIVAWPKAQYGQFYSGDSYIVLHTYKQEDKLLHNVHFWLGETTTQDEAGTAAYKTVELDDFLEGLPVQYREVQGQESEKFLALFPKIEILAGGVESGFKHVEPEKFIPRLLHIKGKLNKTVVRQVPASTDSLNLGDVFVYDCGLNLYCFQPTGAGAGEVAKAGSLLQALDDQRGSKVNKYSFAENDDQKGDVHAKFFWDALGGKKAIKSAKDGGDDTDLKEKKRLFKVSDASGALKVEEIPFARKGLTTADVFITDAVNTIFVWVGSTASAAERKNGFSIAQKYLKEQPHRNQAIPVVRILQGGENEEFEATFQ